MHATPARMTNVTFDMYNCLQRQLLLLNDFSSVIPFGVVKISHNYIDGNISLLPCTMAALGVALLSVDAFIREKEEQRSCVLSCVLLCIV